MEATIPCLLFCHQKHSLNNIVLQEMLHCINDKKKKSMISSMGTGKKNWCWNVCYHISVNLQSPERKEA